MWRRCLRPGDAFIDVGANVGTYTLWAAEAGAHVIAVEPAHELGLALRENLAINGYEVQLIEAACGASNGKAPFALDRDRANSFDPDSPEQVPVVTLDSIVGDGHVRGVKVDVEGFEIDVLRGAQRALSRGAIELLQLEWNAASERSRGRDRSEVEELLTRCGYRLYRCDQSGNLYHVTNPPYGQDVFAMRDPVMPHALRAGDPTEVSLS